MAKFAGLRDPVTLDFEHSTIAYCVDAFSISMGALVGTSPVTAFVESATGISGKFCLSLFVPHITDYYRGWQDRNNRDGHWLHVFYFRFLLAYICINPVLGNW